MKIAVIIQARMGSKRLPGKTLMMIGGKPAIAHVVDRVRRSKLMTHYCVATTTNVEDDTLVAWAAEYGAPCFRGNELNVLDRYYEAARSVCADVVVRVTGDCPLVDPTVIDSVINRYLKGDKIFDYVSNIHPPTFPDGLDVEVFSFKSLECAWREAQLLSEQEHVTPYIWKHPELFNQTSISSEVDLSNNRWTLDSSEDLVFFQQLALHCAFLENATTEEILEIIQNNPVLPTLNCQHIRNEGYEKSLLID